ncbi:MAG: heavy metal sensor histidine kinase [Ideonella sp. WA131b]|jgi:two-component system heavy metal sensor histidine kinase CusS|nr:heavy metal sensor histidine kinase [Ideonella sp. WA131b]
MSISDTALDNPEAGRKPAAAACPQVRHSISRRLSWMVAVQTFIGLVLLCALLWGFTSRQFERKHAEQWEVKASIVQEIVRNTMQLGEAEVIAKMAYYAVRRPDTHLVLQRADGSEFYRDGPPAFDIHSDRVRTDRFVIETPPTVGGGRLVGTLVLDCGEDRAMLAGIALTLLGTALAGGLGVGLLVFRTVKRGLAPMMDLAMQTRAIEADRLGQRLKLAQPVEELQPAVDQFNALMGRLERAYVQLESFNADVAHELRTPLAALIGHTELALSRERSCAELQDTMAANLEELQRLSAMVNDMLFLASADRGAAARRGAPVSLAALARQVIEFHEAALEDAALAVHIDGDAAVAVDEPLVKRALSNLIGNATRYAQPGTAVTVRIAQPGLDAPAQVEVENAGPAITAEQLPRIFDRFFRVDTVRCTAEGGHHGLGLAIVAAIARMHRGEPRAQSADGRTRVGFSIAPH